MLPGEFDYLGLLRKSYRNTIEISDYATQILHHGSFQVYPVQPILRHGEAVVTMECKDFDGQIKEAEKTIRGWQSKGLETIAVICRDREETDRVSKALGNGVELLPNQAGTLEFGNGVLVLPLEYTKGLEFDAVLIFDASGEAYPPEDGYVKRLYVAATRALHELCVLYTGKLTPLIAEPVPEEKKKQAITESEAPVRPALPPEEEKTHEEKAREQAILGQDEMARRQQYGPRRIVITRKHEKESQGGGRKAPDSQGTAPLDMQEERDRSLGRRLTKERPEPGNALKRPAKAVTDWSLAFQQPADQGDLDRSGSIGGTAGDTGNGRRSGARRMTDKTLHLADPGDIHDPYKRPSYIDRLNQERLVKQGGGKSSGEYGEMPGDQSLRAPGHSKIDCSIRMCMKGQGYVDLVSSYGTLRIEVLGKNLVRVCFEKGASPSFPPLPAEYIGKSGPYKMRETRDGVEILTEGFMTRVMKKTGEVAFLTPQGKLLLSERSKDPRQVEEACAFTFFAFGRNEELRAKPLPGNIPMKLGSSAKYISFGRDSQESPALFSPQGYELTFPGGRKTLCCNIPMYGPYVSQEGKGIEYYFSVRR